MKLTRKKICAIVGGISLVAAVHGFTMPENEPYGYLFKGSQIENVIINNEDSEDKSYTITAEILNKNSEGTTEETFTIYKDELDDMALSYEDADLNWREINGIQMKITPQIEKNVEKLGSQLGGTLGSIFGLAGVVCPEKEKKQAQKKYYLK